MFPFPQLFVCYGAISVGAILGIKTKIKSE